MRFFILVVILGCNNSSPTRDIDASVDAVIDGAQITGNPLALTCATSASTYAPAACPPPSGADGHATFCFRPQWQGVTAVEVYVDRGNAGDWTAPFASLADQGDGTWALTTALANGTYPYLFRVHGAADHFIPASQYLLDQTNPAFVPMTPGAPIARSVSQLTVPQVAASIHHVTGSVVVAGAPQPCFVVRFDVGELRKPGGGVLSEHYTANFVESAVDGTFDIPVTDGETQVNVRYPFDLFATYPDPAATPAIGMARQSPIVAGSDLALEPTDVGFDSYAQMAPVTGTATLPVDFTWSLAGSSTAVAVIGTNIAGNDPAYISAYGTGTTATWNGTFGNGMMAKLGTTYYWGSWQKRGSWTSESLLFPIVFH